MPGLPREEITCQESELPLGPPTATPPASPVLHFPSLLKALREEGKTEVNCHQSPKGLVLSRKKEAASPRLLGLPVTGTYLEYKPMLIFQGTFHFSSLGK